MILFNGQFLHEDELHISYQDRGYYFGDGIYEVFRVYEGKLFAKDDHLQRLFRSAEGIRLNIPYTKPQLSDLFEQLLFKEQVSEGILYMQVTRGTAPRSHLFPANAIPTLLAYSYEIVKPYASMQNGITAVTVPDIRWHHCDLKTLNLLPNTLAKQEAADRGADEAILHREGTVTECSLSNFMIVKDGIIRTHQADSHILHGITRGIVLKLAAGIGLPVIEEAFTIRQMLQADEAFVTGTTAEVTPVVRIDGMPVGSGSPGPLTRKLQDEFQRNIGTFLG